MLVFFDRVTYRQISDMTPGVNTIGGKNSNVSINGAGSVWGCSETPGGGGRGVRGQCSLRTFLESKENLDCLKIDLNVVEIIAVQD